MKQEYLLFFIVGLFLLAYVLDAVVDPLNISLASPYQYFTPQNFTHYPFTTASIIIKTIALFLSAILVMSFLGIKRVTKGAILLVVAALMQLYALQDVVTDAQVIPLEWSLSFTLTGVLLLVPAVIYLVVGSVQQAHKGLQEEPLEIEES
jgi:hypothetical protein